MPTQREMLLKTMRRQGVEKTPVEFKFCPAQVEMFKARFGHEDYQTYFNQFHREIRVALTPSFANGLTLYTKETLPADTQINAWGVGHSKGSAAAKHMTRMHHPLKGTDRTLEEIEAYPLPRIEQKEVERIASRVNQLHEQGLAAAGAAGLSPWETSWYIRSMEDLMGDMMEDDPKATRLFERITDVSCSIAKMFANSGCDILFLGDDIGMQDSIMMSVPLWEQWIKPCLMRVIKAAREVKPDILIYYHSCGYVLPFLSG